MRRTRIVAWLSVSAVVLVPIAAPAAPAGAAAPAPAWTISATSEPTNFAPGDSSGRDAYSVVATNSGTAPTDGSTITVTDDLPVGLTLDPSIVSLPAEDGGRLDLVQRWHGGHMHGPGTAGSR